MKHTGYLAGKLQVVQQFGNRVGVQVLDCGISLKSCFLDPSLHHSILNDSYNVRISFC